MHTIVNNIELGFIEITVVGFWDPQHMDGFAADLRRAIAAFPDIGRPPASLYNFTAACIQSQDVVAKMREMAASPAFAGRRVALYTDGGLARMQARRVAQCGENMHVFDTREQALAWLAEVPVPARKAPPVQRGLRPGPLLPGTLSPGARSRAPLSADFAPTA